MPGRRIYWIVALFFFVALLVSHKRSTDYNDVDLNRTRTPSSQQNQQQQQEQQQQQNKRPPPPGESIVKPSTGSSSLDPTTPNTSRRYDTLVVIPSSWTQMQSRRWVRETVFGIRNNLEPCKKHDGRLIYKFYIHGRSTWLRTPMHTAQFMQAQVRDLYAEFMEFDDYHFANKTVTDRHTIWDDALDWAVNKFVPAEAITVDKVLIFDSTTLVNLPKLEDTVLSASSKGTSQDILHSWSETDTATNINNKPFAAMLSFPTAKTILSVATQIKAQHVNSSLVEGAMLYYTRPTQRPTFQIVKGEGQLWTSDIDQVQPSTVVVGQVYQQEDWQPLAEKLSIRPVAPCAVDKSRKDNIAVLTSSYIYVDMCMAEASLPSAENKRAYAKRQGYDFVARSAEFAQEEFRGRRLVWGKIGAIQKVLPHYEWLLWMDMDAIVADIDKDVREIIHKAEEASEHEDAEISMIVSRPLKDKMLNAGVMLIKNTDWSRRFFNEVQRRRSWYHRSPSYEQGAIWEVMQEDRWKSGYLLFDRDDHTMNTFPKYYDDGDFIIHFAPAGCPAVPVLEALGKIMNGESAKGVGI
ncbi:hypothetical protein BG006_005557 [Podila minutissima]|uniref:Glycosyltransferase family 34 protein n=1 Tax=Podila minutissima TaxID=64525 RepID=A0A9P5VM89_9FUNG|nr:hypothetical protein BG006_005557 [Podila minutissima]